MILTLFYHFYSVICINDITYFLWIVAKSNMSQKLKSRNLNIFIGSTGKYWCRISDEICCHFQKSRGYILIQKIRNFGFQSQRVILLIKERMFWFYSQSWVCYPPNSSTIPHAQIINSLLPQYKYLLSKNMCYNIKTIVKTVQTIRQ